MKTPIFKILLIIIGLIIVSEGCERTSTKECIKGMFLGYYCDGCVIKILDKSDIGKNWTATYTTEVYENSVVASVDSNYVKSSPGIEQYLTQGSTFYFQYVKGGYPRKQYNICEPSPFITITSISSTPCQINDKK